MPATKLTPLQQAEALCAGATSRHRADRVRALELLIKAEGPALDRTVFRWIGPRVWNATFHNNLFSVNGNREAATVSLSDSCRRKLGWPAPPLYVSASKRLAGVRALVARAKNVAQVARRTKG